MPVRSVTARSTETRESASVTPYRPGAARSAAWLNRAVACSGSPKIWPTVGRIGMSPNAAQPGPFRWVKLNPDNE